MTIDDVTGLDDLYRVLCKMFPSLPAQLKSAGKIAGDVIATRAMDSYGSRRTAPGDLSVRRPRNASKRQLSLK